ncbi:hypothetical protein T484DRAFT_1888529 [Baffinella frigidus]|nr:hypothetical protein T484DRAFT_1888529 [Cryptophyta sp. CCMP2293]
MPMLAPNSVPLQLSCSPNPSPSRPGAQRLRAWVATSQFEKSMEERRERTDIPKLSTKKGVGERSAAGLDGSSGESGENPSSVALLLPVTLGPSSPAASIESVPPSASLPTLAALFNAALPNSPDSPVLPTEEAALLASLQDGVLLCRLIAAFHPDALDLRRVKMFPSGQVDRSVASVHFIAQNINLAIRAAKSLGCRDVAVHPPYLTEIAILPTNRMRVSCIWREGSARP